MRDLEDAETIKGGGMFIKGAHSGGGGRGAPLLSGVPDAFVFRVKLY